MKGGGVTGKYDSIINLPHHVSESRARLSSLSRAAQFAPFAALNGYGDAIEETARLTGRREELDEETMQLLNRRIAFIKENIKARPRVTVTYFRQDPLKSGGVYLEYSGEVKRIDEINGKMFFADGESLSFADISRIESGLFDSVRD